MEKRGLYIVIEGPDAVGKSNLAHMLVKQLREAGEPQVHLYGEPGGTVLGDEISKLVKTQEMDGQLAFRLFQIARLSLWNEKIKSDLDRNDIVVTTRNYWSSIAYQCFGQGVDLKCIVETINVDLPQRYLQPDMAVILTADAKLLRRRLWQRHQAKRTVDVFENNSDADFMLRVMDGYEQVATQYQVPQVTTDDSVLQAYTDMVDALMQYAADRGNAAAQYRLSILQTLQTGLR